MITVRGIYDGNNIRLLEPVKVDENTRVIITFLEEAAEEEEKEHEGELEEEKEKKI